MSLAALIAEACSLAGDHPCVSSGHVWRSVGGRRCPRPDDEDRSCSGSQTVYQCSRCDEYDYGEPGGPAHADCASGCRW